MALMRFGGGSITAMCSSIFSRVSKNPIQPTCRTFKLGQAMLEESREHINVDKLSKIALVVDGKYKSMKDVPEHLPYRTVWKARDKLRIKLSIGSALFVLLVMVVSIRSNRALKREAEYKGCIEALKQEAATAKAS